MHATRRPEASTACPHGHSSTAPRPGQRALRAAALVALALLAPIPACAIGPEAPVDFLDVHRARGYMVLLVEPDQVVELQVMRVIHRDGEPLSREQVEWKALRMFDYTAPITGPGAFRYREPRAPDRPPRVAAAAPPIERALPRPDLRLARAGVPAPVRDEAPRRVGVLIPLQTAAMRTLADGAYAERFVAQARLAGQPAGRKPLTMVRWSHFTVRDGRPAFISQDEYSRLVDAPQPGVDGAEGRVLLNTGRDIRVDIPVEQTPRNRAVPLGRLGGLVPEREASRPQPARDEARER